MKNSAFKYVLIAVGFATVVLFQNCSDIKLGHMGQSLTQTGLKVEHCAEKSRKVNSKLKFVFVMDRSYSNQCKDAADINCEYGTDPMGDRRFPPILDLVNVYNPNNVSDPLVFWSLINFNEDSRIEQGFTNNSNSFEDFIGNRKDIAQAQGLPLGQYGNTGEIDKASTNYLRALSNAKKIIKDDIDLAKRNQDPMSSTYVVFFISDGEPNQLSGGGYVPQNPEEIYSSIESIVNLGEEDRVYVDGIQINTAFYYEEFNATARSLLTNMALKGRGGYVEFGAGEGIDFNRFRIPSRQLRYDLKELWVVNNNTLWKENRLVGDMDADYLADEDEMAMGSDPYNEDSDGNGVRDGIEVKVLGIPCQSLKDQGACTPLPPPILCGGLDMINGKFDDKDLDKLNSCEEILLGTLPNNFDSNNDSVPDSVGLRFDYPIIKNAGNELYLDRDSDSTNNYRELKEGTNFKVPNDQIPNLKKMSYTTVKVSEDANYSCYDYQILNMPTIGGMNRITVYALEGTQYISQKLELKTVDKNINPNNGAIIESTEFGP